MNDDRRARAREFWKQYEIPFDFGAAIKVRRSGLLRGSTGNGRARDTVVHLHVREAFRDGRLRRGADSYLCEKGSYVTPDSTEGEPDGVVPEVTCSTCLERMDRWKVDP